MISNFAVALAIAAATAEATQWGATFGGSQHQPSRIGHQFSPSYGQREQYRPTSSLAHELTSWAKKSDNGYDSGNPAYPSRNSFTPSYKPNYAPSGSPHGSHAHDHEVYPDHSASFNRFEAETTPAEVPTHAPAYSRSYYGSSKPSYGQSKYG